MQSPTLNEGRHLKMTPTDCKGFVRLSASDGKGSKVESMQAARVVDDTEIDGKAAAFQSGLLIKPALLWSWSKFC